jgi:O-antigen/teichoic acid export membrane protein
MDLFALKILGGTAAAAGFYGAAMNLAFAASLFSVSLSRTLHSTLVRLMSVGDTASADRIITTALRCVLLLLPFGAMTVGVCREVVLLTYGEAFAETAAILAVYIFVPVFLLQVSIAGIVAITRGRSGLYPAVTLPMVVLAGAGHLVFTPRFGGLGAAGVTAGVAFLGAAASMVVLHRVWGFLPPWKSLVRVVLASGAALAAAGAWPVGGWLVLPRIGGISLVILLTLMALGEFSREDVHFIRRLFRQDPGNLSGRSA